MVAGERGRGTSGNSPQVLFCWNLFHLCGKVVDKAAHCIGASSRWVQIWTDERREGISAKSHPWSLCGSLQKVLPLDSGTACLLGQWTLVVSLRCGPWGGSTFQLERVWSEGQAGGCQGFLSSGVLGEAGTGGRTDGLDEVPPCGAQSVLGSWWGCCMCAAMLIPRRFTTRLVHFVLSTCETVPHAAMTGSWAVCTPQGHLWLARC